MTASMLEQIAQRFELYASDQITMLARHQGSKQTKLDCQLRAQIWNDAAAELRKIGADNRNAFAGDVLEIIHGDWLPTSKAADITKLFI